MKFLELWWCCTDLASTQAVQMRLVTACVDTDTMRRIVNK